MQVFDSVREDRDVGSGVRQSLGNRAPETASCSSNQSHLAG